jgi:hypothetical protein
MLLEKILTDLEDEQRKFADRTLKSNREAFTPFDFAHASGMYQGIEWAKQRIEAIIREDEKDEAR